jgi:hypothetical protein
MTKPISCEGAPRDQGLSQGSALRAPIRDWASRVGASARRSFLSSLRPLAAGPVLGSGAGREVLRHHPHIAERIDGLARGAELPLASLMQLVIPGAGHAACTGVAPTDAPAHVAHLSDSEQGGLARALPAHAAPGCRWILRRSLPEVGFRSVEVTLPWQASCVAGVNERGLAIAIVPEVEGSAAASLAAPAILLIQDCLQRFADLDSALEWCAGRPVAPGVSIAVSDESGNCAAARLTAEGCRVQRSAPGQETIVCGGASDSAAELRKRLDAGEPPLTALRSGGAAGALVLDPKARSLRLEWQDGSAPVVESAVPSAESDPVDGASSGSS